MKKALSVLFAATTLAAVCATPAFAGPANSGFIVFTTPTTPSGGLVMTGPMNSTFAATGMFDDVFFFITPPPDAVDAQFTIAAGTGVTFSGFTIDYFGGGGDPIWTTETVLPTSINIDIPGGLISGVYQIDVTGTALAGSSYSGTVSVTVEGTVPVPEASSYALLAAGLGGLGFVLRRRA